MWQYEKKLQYPVNIKNPNPKLAKVIISQLGGLNVKEICLFAQNIFLKLKAADRYFCTTAFTYSSFKFFENILHSSL